MACPSPLLPQQETELLLFTPQVWFSPASMETKEPAGGVGSFFHPPQQSTEPLFLTPQVW